MTTSHIRPEPPKTYDPAEVEPRRYTWWERAGVFHEEPDPARPPFAISMPPPNITGKAHLGHASTYTPMDLMTRYHRMLGENAVWIPGQDHAAIATEAVLVRELAREGLTRDGLGREAFLARAWQWREQYGGEINQQFRRLGFGPDWQRERFTMDAGLSAAVIKVFVQLYREGLIYRGTRLVNWDPVAKSTLSDAEVDYDERDGFLWHLRYSTPDGAHSVVVATTRPETMLGDTAVAVHPEDERYRELIGKHVVLPLTGRLIPVVADAAVERDFGTGAVKVTPAHDQTDYEIGLRHGLAMPTVIDFDGRIVAPVFRDETNLPTGFNTSAGRETWTRGMAPYVGLDRFEARKAVARDLASAGALVKTEPYRHKVSLSSRSGQVIEPLLSLQWFAKMESLARPALAAFHDGRIRFVPERFGRTYEQWLENIRDWNISRQVWWGHQLPVWYTPSGDVIVAEREAEALDLAQRLHGTSELRRDPDTLDTWFSSGLWPISILGWPEVTEELAHWYPNSVMVTSRDIIFLWVARMVMLGMHFAGDVPFREVFITPLVFDIHGRKMSKSLGNAIDPIDLIRDYGADGTRLGIVRQMRLESQELRFDERYCDEAKRFATKLWNATRFTLGQPGGLPSALVLPTFETLTLADRWILTRLRALVSDVTNWFDRYEFGLAAERLVKFGWYEFCDWYLEATKADGQEATRGAVLSYTLNTLVRLLHPIAPFFTEEIWQALPHDGDSIVTASWPDAAEIPYDASAAAVFDVVVETVEKARNFRAELQLPPKERLQIDVPAELDESLRALLAVLAHAGVTEASTVALPDADGSQAELLRSAVVRAPAALMRERNVREIKRLDGEVLRLEKKLGGDFILKAPPEIVAKEREKLDAYRRDRERARTALAELGEST